MPKEMTHWYLADRVKARLPRNSVFFEPVHTCENLFFLGAVVPDIPFYYLLGPRSARIQAAAEPFHRPDARALMPVLTFLEPKQNPDMDARALSLGAGIICHILADTVFHPLVYYYSGMSRVHPGAMARHRRFETALDLYFLHLAGHGFRTCLGRTLSQTEVTKETLLRHLGRLFSLEKPGDSACLGYAVRSHVFYQALFQKNGIYRMLSYMNKTLGHRFLDQALSLFYPKDQTENTAFFEHGIEFRDPDSGLECCAGIPDLVRETESGSLALLARMAEQMLRQRPLMDLAEDGSLPRVRPGMAHGRFWRGKPDLMTDLYRKNRS